MKTIFTWNFEDHLIDYQPCFIPNLKFLAVQEPNFLESKYDQNRLFCMYIGMYIGYFSDVFCLPYRLASLLMMHTSEFVFCQMQISVSHISAYENDFRLKFWRWSNWPPILLHTKFQVFSSPGTHFSKIQIWPKSAVNPILNVLTIDPASVFCTLFGFDFGVM